MPPPKPHREVTVFDIEGNSYTHSKIRLVFIILSLLNVSNNLDHGGIPVMTPVLRQELSLTTQQLGVIGSLVFFGLLCGSLQAAFVFGKVNYKRVMLLTYVGNGFFLILFASTEIYWLQCLSRFLAGYF